MSGTPEAHRPENILLKGSFKMRIQHNITAMNAYRNYNTNTSALSKNLEKLSSGYKINRAGDDAAGLAISEKMRAQITGLSAAQKNVKDGTSLVKTAEGAMQEIHDMLNRMDYLATQSANGTYDNEVDRANLQKEVESLKSEINRIADSANFNGINLLDGSQASQSIAAVGDMITDDMVDGTAASAGGKAQITVTLNSAKVNSTAVDASSTAADTFDGVDPAAATGATYTFKVADTTGTDKTKIGDAGTGNTQVELDGTKDVTTLLTATDDNGTLLKDIYDITVTDADGNARGASDKITTGDIITFTAKNKGVSGGSNADVAAFVADTDGAVAFVDGVNEGAAGAASEAKYEINLDLTKLEGGQKLEIGGKTITVSNKTGETTAGQFININGKNLSDDTDRQTLGGEIKTSLETAFSDFDVTVKVDATSGKAAITMQGKAGKKEGCNLGEVHFITNSNTNPLDSYTYTKYSAGDSAAAGKYAQVTYENDALKNTNLKAGSTLKIGDVTIKVVADSVNDADVKSDEIKEGNVTSKLAEVIEKQAGTNFGLATYTAASGKLVFTSKDPGAGKLEDLKTATKITVETPDPDPDANPTTIVAGNTALNITPGNTTLADLKAKTIDGVKVGDLFNIRIEDKTDGDAIALGDKITFEAKQTGKLSDTVMNALKYTTGASTEIREGWDEGTTGSGNNTHYELAINTGKLVGGQSFSFGTGSKTTTFDITFDDIDTDNGTISTPDKGTEVGAGRTKINISKSMSDREIADKIKDVVGNAMGGFNVKTEINGSTIKLSLDAKEATEATNLGGVRYSSAAGAFSGAVYKAYNAFDGGTEGTYAQVSYDFDISKLQSGDTLTIGSTSIKIGDKTATEKDVNGNVKSITLAEEDAQNAEELVKAFESAGYQSGQIKIADGKLTITGTEAGQKAADLAKAGGKVAVTSTRALVSGGLTLQIGDTSDNFNQMTVSIGDMHTKAMGIADIDIGTQQGAQGAIDVIKDAINYVSSVRGDLGATQNRLDHTANNLSVMAENIQDAESTIRDTDVAEEMMSYVKNNILVQSAQAMLAQANQLPQGVLQLLG